jgi:tetratricopeptide (TPR) repeat protein
MTLFATTQVRAGFLPSFTGRASDHAQADTMYQQANAAYQAGDYAGAYRLLDAAEKLKPDQADGWNLRGVILLKQKEFDKAEAAFTRSVEIDPNLWAAQFNQAEAPFQKKDFVHARVLFDRLLAHTDRYKDTNKWELVVYKSFLCSLLAGDEAEAQKRLAKLPTVGGRTPALLYVQAALAFQRKDAATARKIVGTAQTQFPPATNELFAPGLEVAGWQAPPVTVAAGAAGGLPLPSGTPMDPATMAAMNAAGVTNPGNLYLPPMLAAARSDTNRPAVTIDPKVESAAAEPLPAAPGKDLRPVVGQLTLPGPEPTKAGPAVAAHRAAAEKVVASPSVSVRAQGAQTALTTQPDSALDHGGLLLDFD